MSIDLNVVRGQEFLPACSHSCCAFLMPRICLMSPVILYLASRYAALPRPATAAMVATLEIS
jgi:hypothetical protein